MTSDVTLDVVDAIKRMTSVEGFVIRFEDDGSMLKCKTEWYSGLHGYCTRPGSVLQSGVCWKACFDGTIDDLIASVPAQEVKDQLRDFNTSVWRCVSTVADKLRSTLDATLDNMGAKSSQGGTRKVQLSREQVARFSDAVNDMKELPTQFRAYLFQLQRDATMDVRMTIVKDMLKRLGRGGSTCKPHQGTVDMLQQVGNDGQPLLQFIQTAFEVNSAAKRGPKPGQAEDEGEDAAAEPAVQGQQGIDSADAAAKDEDEQ